MRSMEKIETKWSGMKGANKNIKKYEVMISM